MKSRRRTLDRHDAPGSDPTDTANAEASGIGRSNTTGRSVGSAIKKRIGSIRRRKQEIEA
jgi:hypothetical protein